MLPFSSNIVLHEKPFSSGKEKEQVKKVSPVLQDKARRVLSWAEQELEKKTFPRDDYREFMELVVVSLGGTVKGFTFKLPGPDHHARWMSKCLYFLKINLLRKMFLMSEEERLRVERLAEFMLLFYAEFWFTAPLASSAARQALDFMSGVLEYRLVDPQLSFMVLKSCYRHL